MAWVVWFIRIKGLDPLNACQIEIINKNLFFITYKGIKNKIDWFR